MNYRVLSILCLTVLFFVDTVYAQCSADAGTDLSICDGDGSSSNYTYLDGSGSTVSDGDVNYEWTVLNSVGDEWEETLVITNSESDEMDPRFKYPKELAVDTEFLVQLRVYDDAESCEDLDTVKVFIKSNMCPRADAGEDQTLSNGCDFIATLDGTDSEDPQDEEITFLWSSLDGYNDNFIDPTSASTDFEFPATSSDQVFSFVLTVSDAEQSTSDTVNINYLDNDAPVADAGVDFATCDYEFYLSSAQSYDVNWNTLSYSWTSLDGLSISGENSRKALVTSPTDLTEATEYRVVLKVDDGFCASNDTLRIVIESNLCPVADAGETKRIPKYQSSSTVLDAGDSFDPDGTELEYNWIAPDGTILQESTVTVIDQSPNERYTNYEYILQVMDSENAISADTVEVIFSYFSAPQSPNIYAVASHGQVLVSWDASSEAAYDSLSGYSDFEGYKLYRSIDGGLTWGGEDEKLYDFNGEFVGWVPYAQFDFNMDEDYFHCIYDHNGDCESEDTRRTFVNGLDPYLPRFSLGSDIGLEYSYIDSNVIDGVEYTYTVTAYDMGLPKFDISFTEVDSSGIFTADTVWPLSNPANFVGPDFIDFFGNDGSFLRRDANPLGGYPFLESDKGKEGDHNFITVVPGYTALDIAFPDEDDIEALFTSQLGNIGTGERNYFIVDRTKIVQDLVRYEIQASQSPIAVEGMACEDPFVYGYSVLDSTGTPRFTDTYYKNNLNFIESDSISKLPGAVEESDYYEVPQYEIITSVDKWSDQFKGIRFKMKNIIPLNVSAVPPVTLDKLEWYWDENTLMDSTSTFLYQISIFPALSYTNVSSYLRRLNFDYKIEFFSDAEDGSKVSITNASGSGDLYFPFKITNMWTGKEVGLKSNDYGSLNSSPIDYNNGASDFVWTPGEEIFLIQDSLRIAGAWLEAYNYNLNLNVGLDNEYKSRKAYDPTKEYSQGDTIFYQGSLWHAINIPEFGVTPQSIFLDKQDDGERNNPWRPAYLWVGGEQLIIKPSKLFVDGDSWFSDMSKLGENVGVSDTLCLDSIKVVPNPYKASSKFNETSDSRRIRFTNLPTQAQISIYTVAGEHVTTFEHSEQFDGNAWWNLRTGNSQEGPEIAPGLYIYAIEFPQEQEYCIDTYDDSGDVQGSLKNDFYSNSKYDNKKLKKKTKYHIGKFAVIR